LTYQTSKRKDHSLSAIFLRNPIILFSCKACDKLIAMTGKKGGVPMLVGELWPFFQLTKLNIKANLPSFQCARARANDAINYAQ